eukprot:g6283.t1
MISFVAVYGDWSGDWVNEQSETRTNSSRGQLRLSGEKEWMNLFHHHSSLPIHIFRLGGIYGPGRNLLESIIDEEKNKRTSINKQRRSSQQWINRCHVYDICQVLSKSMECPSPGEIYNVVDDQPSPRAYALNIAHGLKREARIERSVPMDFFGFKGSSAMKPSRFSEAKLEEKRVRNLKLKTELDITLAYPSIDVGLLAISQGDKLPFLY